MKTVSILIVLFICCCFVFCKKDAKIVMAPLPGSSGITLDVLAKNLDLPWGLVYLPNGDLLFTERIGKINLLPKGAGTFVTLMQRSVNTVSEGGLLSIAIDPDFSANHFVYIYETTSASMNRVVRLSYINGQLSQEQVIVDQIPYGVNHDGGALKFGPDRYLYIGTGDVLQSSLAQDKNSLAGKILRVDRDGNAPPDNPFSNRIWTYGHRNVQGFTWLPDGHMLATEHGPSGENGWCCHDEINLIHRGNNYGWPLAYGGAETGTLTPSLINSGDDTWAPSGCIYLSDKALWPNTLVVATLRGQRLLRLHLNADGTAITSVTDTLRGQLQRIRNVVEAADGSLVFCSSNIGSIASPGANDDKIYHLYRK